MPDDRFLSEVSAEGHTVIPFEVRERLRLRPGDTVRYVVRRGEIVLERATPEDRPLTMPEDDPFSAFDEWAGEADDRAYAEL